MIGQVGSKEEQHEPQSCPNGLAKRKWAGEKCATNAGSVITLQLAAQVRSPSHVPTLKPLYIMHPAISSLGRFPPQVQERSFTAFSNSTLDNDPSANMGALTENRFYDIRDFLKSPPLAFVLLFLGLAAYTIYGAIWRLYLSPVAHIPGPWFAKLTFWNEFYYDVILGGQYTWKLPEYHAKYGG